MKDIMEEYGEVLLAVIGAIGVLGATMTLLWGNFSQQIAQYIA